MTAFLLLKLPAAKHSFQYLVNTSFHSNRVGPQTRAVTNSSTNNMLSTYIPHLDGIRALALAGVLLFHFDVKPFGGGYVGVDVFLTLSGFLITRNIIHSLHSKKSPFSLRTFYVRRFFRLFPASLVCTFVSAMMAIVMFPPKLATAVFESALASMLSFANVYFWYNTNYFDTEARFKPLLHHWSLSLEEQFYLIWPPLLLLALHYSSRFKRSALLFILFALLTASYTAAVVLARRHTSFVFFMLPSRIFQFSAGALCAVTHRIYPLSSLPTCKQPQSPQSPLPRPSITSYGFLAELACLSATAVILIMFVLLPPGTSPHLVAPVTIATLFLISLPDTSFSTKILAHPLTTYLGRLSYSAYLVHWPIYVYIRYAAPALHQPAPSAFLLTLLTLVLASTLHRVVEQPFRRPRRIHGAMLSILIVVTIGICMTGLREKGFESRAPDYNSMGFPRWERRREFHSLSLGVVTQHVTNRTKGIVARVGAVRGGKRSRYVFVGNSFAGHLRVGLHAMGKERGVWFQVHAVPGCPVRTLDVVKRNSLCYQPVQQIWREIQQLPKGSTIVLANLWCNVPFDQFRRQVPRIRDLVRKMGGHSLMLLGEPPGILPSALGYFDCAAVWLLPGGRLLEAVAQWITHRRHTLPRDGTACQNIRQGLPPKLCIAQRAQRLRTFMRSVSDVRFIDVFREVCERGGRQWKHGERCRLPVWFDDNVLYNVGYQMDGSHLSPAGSYFVGVNVIGKALNWNETFL